MHSITVNASPLITLGSINRIHLICDLFKKLGDYSIFITKKIFDEVKTARKELKDLIKNRQFILYDKTLPYEEVIKIAAEVATNSRDLDPKNHLGEAEIIWLAEKLDSDFVIIDESAAKSVIKGRSHLTHLQVLEQCVTKGIIKHPEALKIFRELRKTVKYNKGVVDNYEHKWRRT